MTNSELKAKVMTLGNRLAPRMGDDRRAAFIQAWAIVKAGGLTPRVRGVSFGSRQEALRRLAVYAPEQIKLRIRSLEELAKTPPSKIAGYGIRAKTYEKIRNVLADNGIASEAWGIPEAAVTGKED
jgi:hypothetical protein